MVRGPFLGGGGGNTVKSTEGWEVFSWGGTGWTMGSEGVEVNTKDLEVKK